MGLDQLLSKLPRRMVQVLLDPGVGERLEAARVKLKHATLGRILRYCVNTGLESLEEGMKKKGRKS